MKKLLACIPAGVFGLFVALAQEPYPELGAKLDEYFIALAGESAAVQNAECDFLISACQDSLVRQYTALKIYDHYLKSRIMGDDAVAVHVAQKWFMSGAVKMKTDEDMFHAQLFAQFNQSSLIGMQAPRVKLFDTAGETVEVPSLGAYNVLYFYDTGCSTCASETPRLLSLARAGKYPITVYAIYVGASEDAWRGWQAGKDCFVHLWDPSVSSDWQRLYGVLQTPRMFLVNPSGVIVGRGLDTGALELLLNKELGREEHVYGQEGEMSRMGELFAAYGDSLSASDVMDVADYLAARTFGEGDVEAFKQVMGDMLYYISSQKTEVFRDAVVPFVQKYINLPEVWNTDLDKAQVVSLGELLADLASRTPVGSVLPDIKVPGVLRKHKCLFSSGTRSGEFSLSSFGGRPGYVVFYTGGCSSCKETLEAVDSIVGADRRVRVLLVDLDNLQEVRSEIWQQLMDSFDLSALPMIIEVDKKGVVQHRYVNL